MKDKINELKALIEALSPESSLRKSLEEAMAKELKCKAKADTEAKKDTPAAESQSAEESEENTSNSGESSSIPDGITGKLDELLEDEEFIAASAGFLLGAAAIGAGALALSALKK